MNRNLGMALFIGCVFSLLLLVIWRMDSGYGEDYERALDAYAIANHNIGKKISREGMTRYIQQNIDSTFVLDSMTMEIIEGLESDVLKELVEENNKENE